MIAEKTSDQKFVEVVPNIGLERAVGLLDVGSSSDIATPIIKRWTNRTGTEAASEVTEAAVRQADGSAPATRALDSSDVRTRHSAEIAKTSTITQKTDATIGEVAVKTGPRVLSEAEKKLYGRVSFPKGFRQQVWELAKAPDGNVYDPTGRIIKYDEPWELGHVPDHKFSEAQLRAATEGWDRETWIRYQTDPLIYRPELPSTNASHMWE